MRFPTSIPLVMREVRITGPNGTISVDLILDTGAVLTALSWSDLRAIGYDPAVAAERREIITANGVVEVPKLRVAHIAVGPLVASAVDVICHDIPELTRARGLLGLSFLERFRTVIDYRGGYVELS